MTAHLARDQYKISGTVLQASKCIFRSGRGHAMYNTFDVQTRHLCCALLVIGFFIYDSLQSVYIRNIPFTLRCHAQSSSAFKQASCFTHTCSLHL